MFFPSIKRNKNLTSLEIQKSHPGMYDGLLQGDRRSIQYRFQQNPHEKAHEKVWKFKAIENAKAPEGWLKQLR
jgi:hypothetical protein